MQARDGVASTSTAENREATRWPQESEPTGMCSHAGNVLVAADCLDGRQANFSLPKLTSQDVYCCTRNG